MAITLPLDFNVIRKGLVRAVQSATGLTCILEEPVIQNAPRPELPYFSMKIIVPAAKSGDDSSQYSQSGTVFNRGGQRQMTVSFHCYTVEHEDAYNYMTLWQSSLETLGVQEALRKIGVAVWVIGSVADLTQLLNTGYEARAQMDVRFGVAANIAEDLGEIRIVEIEGTIDTENGTVTENFTVVKS